jgi:hypothetical protein
MAPPHVVLPAPTMEYAVPAQRMVPARTVTVVRECRDVAMHPVVTSTAAINLMTPQYELHCDRLCCVNAPDRLVLEGNVRVTYRKNGQQYRIEGERVLMNLKDGTFTVDTNSHGATWQRQPGAATELRQSIHIMPVPTSYED